MKYIEGDSLQLASRRKLPSQTWVSLHHHPAPRLPEWGLPGARLGCLPRQIKGIEFLLDSRRDWESENAENFKGIITSAGDQNSVSERAASPTDGPLQFSKALVLGYCEIPDAASPSPHSQSWPRASATTPHKKDSFLLVLSGNAVVPYVKL